MTLCYYIIGDDPVNGITRRNFLVYATLALAQPYTVLAQIQPSNRNLLQVQSHGTKFYSFDARINFFGLFGFDTRAKLEVIVNGEDYSASLVVFEEKNENSVLYLHKSEGFIKYGLLLPNRSFIKRNFDYWLLKWLGYDRNDESISNFVYNGRSLVEVLQYTNDIKGKSENTSTINVQSNSIDSLTAILQATLDLKNGKKLENASLMDRVGRQKIASITSSKRSFRMDLSGQEFDFKNANTLLDSNFEPVEIKIEGLYGRADLEIARQ